MKKNILAIILVFAMLAGFASCKKLENEGEWVVESKVYVTDEYGAQHDVQSVTRTDGETEYYYYNTDGNRVTVAHKDVVVSTTKIYKPAPTTLSPEQQSFIDAYTDPDAFQELVDENVTQPQLDMSEDLISDDVFNEVGGVELDADGKPVRGDKDKAYEEILKGDSFTADFYVKSDFNGQETAVPFYTCKDGNNLYIKTSMPVDGGAMAFEFLIVNKECYIIIPAMRAYVKVPAETLEEMIPQEALEQEMESTYVKSGQVELNGETYDVDVYDADGQTIKYYYLDDQLKRVESTDGENTSIVQYNEIKKGADKSKFKVPTGYIDMTTMMGENFDINTLA